MGYIDPFGMDTLDYNTKLAVQMGDDIRLKDGSVMGNSLPDVNVYWGNNSSRGSGGLSSYLVGVPVLESGFSSGEKLGRGDYMGAAADFGTALFEIATFGTGTTLKAGLTLASRGMATKTGTQITKHAAERMVERGITQKMVETGISKGTKYLDPKNGTFNYVLKNGFASGKDLLIGVSPQTGKVTTVLRGNNLVNKRFIPQ